MKQFLLCLLLGQCLLSYAQHTTSSNKLRFRSTHQVGFQSGEAGTELQLQTINGIQYKTFSTGIGVGLDYYKERSVPLFLNVQKNLLQKPRTPFIYADGGYHFAWPKEKPEEWMRTDVEGGLYYDLGIGYRFPAFKTGAVHISLGYSVKEVSEKVKRNIWISSLPMPEDFQRFDYTLRRYSFKMGLTL